MKNKIKFNIPVRFRNPVFIVQVVGAFLFAALSYNNMQPQDLTTWTGLGNMIAGIFANPFLLCSCLWSAWCAFNDPTTAGVKDSERVLTYKKPNKTK